MSLRKYRGKIRRPPDYFKPENYKHFLTVKELAIVVGKDPHWIRKLERQGKLPIPPRVQRGKLRLRLYPPSQVEEIKEYFQKNGRR